MLLTEMIQELASRIYIGGNVLVRVADETGQVFAVKFDGWTFATDPSEPTPKLMAVIPVVRVPGDTLPAEQPHDAGG